MPLLTICIPTYNRASLLAELLQSIATQKCLDQLAVVVSDDASSDDTVSVAESFHGKIGHLQVVRQSTNLGMDRNFLTAISLAKTDYVWLMGDDDVLEPGGVDIVINALRRWPDVVGLTLGVVNYDAEMRRIVSLPSPETTRTLRGKRELFTRLPERLGFMSALVVKASLWSKAVQNPAVQTIQNNYVQVVVLGLMVGDDGQWGVVAEPCVRFRSDNDQLASRLGWLERLKIDVRAYDEAAAIVLFGHTRTAKIFKNKIFRSHIVARIINGKTRGHDWGATIGCLRYLLPRYWNNKDFWVIVVPLLLAPTRMLVLARAAYKKHSPTSASRRADKALVNR